MPVLSYVFCVCCLGSDVCVPAVAVAVGGGAVVWWCGVVVWWPGLGTAGAAPAACTPVGFQVLPHGHALQVFKNLGAAA